MPPDDDYEMETAPFREYRRLFLSELQRINNMLQGFDNKLDQLNNTNRDRISLVETSLNTQISDVKTRVAMLEVRAKIWGGMVGCVGGAVASGLIVLIEKLAGK